jgi:hypothetical protein
MVQEILGRYPSSSYDGNAIPLEIIRPKGFLYLDFTEVVASTPVQLPDGTDVYNISSNVDCVALFAATSINATLPAMGTLQADTLYIPEFMHITFTIPIDKRYISLIAVSTAGRAFIQQAEAWSGLARLADLARR